MKHRPPSEGTEGRAEVVFVREKKSSLRGYERKDQRHRDTVVDMKIYTACNKFMQPSPSYNHGRGYRKRRKRIKHDQN